eukprot:scaffold3849_cov179-Amphora_coffeaeformis.AAC.20
MVEEEIPYQWPADSVVPTEVLQLWTEVENGLEKSQTGDCGVNEVAIRTALLSATIFVWRMIAAAFLGDAYHILVAKRMAHII